MKDVIILKTPYNDDSIFCGCVGKLIIKETNFEFGEVEVMYEDRRVTVYVDTNNYVLFSPLLKELF